MKLIEKPLELLRKKSPAFQRYIDHHHSNDVIFIPAKNNHIVYDPDTNLYYMLDPNIRVMDEVKRDYDIVGLTKNDVVLDLGANVGFFSIPISKKVKWVFAVEPLWTDNLLNNIEMNNIKNITVLPYGLGASDVEITYENRTSTIKCVSLTRILEMCGEPPTFIKMDVEGRKRLKSGEWCITLEEVKLLTKVWGWEIELHCYEGEGLEGFLEVINGFNQRTDKYLPSQEAQFDLNVTKNLPVAYLIHARRKVK